MDAKDQPAGSSRHIAVYGKGGIGKSTVVANLAILFAQAGHKVLLIGCDPKHDTSHKVSNVYPMPTVLDLFQTKGSRIGPEEYLVEGRWGVTCVEAGGPEPGVGCAGRGITKMFEVFESAGIFARDYDIYLYDVLGDVVCGGFAVPMRTARATEVLVVVSGEIMALYAANNLCRALARLERSGVRLAGFVGNYRGLAGEPEMLRRFADRLGTRMLHGIPRSSLVAEAERLRRTVVEHAPDSPQAGEYRQLFAVLEGLTMAECVTPRPMGDLGFDEFVRDSLTGAPDGTVPA